MSELEHQLSTVSTLVQKDPLTNALNRRGLEEAFRVESARAERYRSPLTLAMLDLDNFKRVNDTLGHVAGDRALIHFVTTAHATLRPTDLTARYGGEEFGVLLQGCLACAGRPLRGAVIRTRKVRDDGWPTRVPGVAQTLAQYFCHAA